MTAVQDTVIDVSVPVDMLASGETVVCPFGVRAVTS